MKAITGTPAATASFTLATVPSKIGTTAMPSYCLASAASMPASTASAVSAVPSWM